MLYPPDKLCSENTVPYTAQTDDTFFRISKHFNITLDELLEANPAIDPDQLKSGDILCIPLPTVKMDCPVGSEAYIIQPGDSIYKLSKRFHVKLSTLLKANHRLNPDVLLPGQKIFIPHPWSKFTDSEYKLELIYPIRWAKVSDHHYEGMDGFFKLLFFYSEQGLQELCKEEAYHKLKPYGCHPSIIDTTAAGLAACMVIPSIDQPMEMKKQSALILEYPKTMKYKNTLYNHLMLWADYEHIEDIAKSIRVVC